MMREELTAFWVEEDGIGVIEVVLIWWSWWDW